MIHEFDKVTPDVNLIIYNESIKMNVLKYIYKHNKEMNKYINLFNISTFTCKTLLLNPRLSSNVPSLQEARVAASLSVCSGVKEED